MTKWFDDSRGATIPILRFGEVIDNSDAKGTGEIKVRIDGVDKLDGDNDLIPALPLLPKFLNVYPQVGECVFIIEYEHKVGPKFATKNKRYWIGPVISQLQFLEKDGYKNAQTQEIDGYSKPSVNIETLKEANGVYPTKEDIALQGRDNTDIIFKPKEIRIRAGKWDITDNLKYNKKDPAYIQLKYGNSEIKKEFIDETKEIKVFIPPTHVINVSVESFMGAKRLPNESSEMELMNADRNFVNISVKDTNTNSIVESFNNNGNFYNTRLDAIKEVIEKVKGYMGSYPKWKVLTDVKEVLDKYGENNQSSRQNKVILYPNNTQVRTETKKILKTKKVVTGKEGSVVNIVASKINLLSHDGEHTFDLTNPVDLISSETQNKINSEAHPLVYGDKLVEFLNLVKDYIRDHTHPFPMDPAVDGIEKTNALEFNLETILNKNVNSN